MGLGKFSNIVYLTDYGLAKKYKELKTQQHILYKETKKFLGTARFASINSHLCIEQSRRDDLESLGYVLVYLCKGGLPWQRLKANNRQDKYHKIMEKKMATSVEVLCQGLPFQFTTYLNYIRSLKYEEKPDYSFLKRLFKDLFIRNDYKFDYLYDWCLLAQKSQSVVNYSSKKINI